MTRAIARRLLRQAMMATRIMSYDVTSEFTPDRDRVADAGAAVPIIDLAPLSHGKASDVVEAVKQACEHVGFFVITGHGVSG